MTLLLQRGVFKCPNSTLLRALSTTGITPGITPMQNHNDYLKHPSTVAIVGAPMTYAQPKLGADLGPDMLRKAGLMQKVSELGWAVEETGNLLLDSPLPSDPQLDPKYGKAKQCFAVGKAIRKIRDKVYEKAEEGKFVLTLGGDHSIAAGSLSGILSHRPDTGCIWVDAHADINTPAGSGSGNMHGMPISFLTKSIQKNKTVPGLEWMAKGPWLPPSSLVYVALRDVDADEKIKIKELGIKAFSMQQVDKYGMGKVMEMSLDYLCKKKQRPLHVSYDIDAVDPLNAPSTGTTVRGGLTFREAIYLCEAVAETNLLSSFDCVEVNPTLANQTDVDTTVDMGLSLIIAALGSRILL